VLSRGVERVTRYRTIVADPPWQIPPRLGPGGRRKNETAVPYSMMTLDDIKALPVADFKHDGGTVLFLWSTRKAFREGWAVAVARAWGFEPCGELIWGLRNPGTGTRTLANDHEPCLIAKSGKWAQLSADESLGVHFWRQVYEWNPKARVPQKVHSAKPPGLLELVEQIAEGPYLELFARESRLGWDTWGNEALEHVQMTEGAA
jgi:N6-adenosine-specific RNA methylase IME4